MSSSKLSFISIDINDMAIAEAFWCAVLGAKSEGSDTFKKLPIPDSEMSVFLQLVPEKKTSKTRMHLDMTTTELDEETVRLERLGAKIISPAAAEGFRFVVFADPFGNEFCLLAA